MSNQMNVPPSTAGSGGGLQPNVASCLCYLCGWLTGLIFFLIEKENRMVRFHALHAIALNIVFFAGYVAVWILTVVMAALLGPLAMIFALLNIVLVLGYVVVVIVSMIKAYQGSELSLPVITEWVKSKV